MQAYLNRHHPLYGVIIVALIVLVAGDVQTVSAQRRRRRIPDTSPYEAVQSSLVLISMAGGRSFGSGFIWLDADRKYLVTNEHVARAGRPLEARLLNGRILTLTTLELAVDRDLIRFALDDSVPAPGLSLASRRPGLDDGVWVFGNSDGSGVVTREYGRVLGVGFDRIEIDAGFVGGNSGSPIVDEHGKVLGVATYAVRREDPEDWVTQGTRYSDARRFGLTLDDIEWQRLDPEAYWARADALRDMAIYCEDLRQIYNAGFFSVAVTRINYDYETRQADYTVYKNLAQSLGRSVQARNQIIVRLDHAVETYQTAKQSRGRGGRSMSADHDLEWQLRMAEREQDNLWNAFNDAMREGLRLLDHDHWLTPTLQQEATTLLSYLRDIKRHYESMR